MKISEHLPEANLFVVMTAATLVAAIMFPAVALAIDNPLAFDVYLRNGGRKEASVTIFQSGSHVLVNVIGRSRTIPKRAALTLNAGACGAPGDIAFALARFRANSSLTELRHTNSDIVKRAKSLVIHTTSSETSSVFACGSIRD